MRSHRSVIALAMLIMLLLGGCGRTTSGQTPGNGIRPDSVHIKTIPVTGEVPVLVVVDSVDAARALFDAALALPPAPTERACPAIAGPRYELTFLAAGQTVLTATADRGGCPSVTFGANDVRDANDVFWKLLDRTIADATPPTRTSALTAFTFAAVRQPPSVAHIASPDLAQRVYDAIRALPEQPQQAQPKSVCPANTNPRYELLFTATTGARIHALAQRGDCAAVLFVPGSTRQPDAAFWATLDSALASTTRSPAQPDQLDLKTEPAAGAPSGTAMAATTRAQPGVRDLYQAVYALPPLPQDARCPATPGTRYYLSFSSESVSLLSVIADASGCGTVSLANTDNRLASPAFWDLLHQLLRA